MGRSVATEDAPPEPWTSQLGSPAPAACQLGIITLLVGFHCLDINARGEKSALM